MTLSDKAYHLIKHKIVTLELPPSSLIDEQQLTEELGIGRTPVREALRQLAAEKLVTIVPRRGAFVADISITDLQKLFEVRAMLEGFCARLAVQRITLDQIAQMEVILQDMEKVENGNTRALMDIDERFHGLLYQAADNEFLAEELNRLYDLSLRLWHLALNSMGDVQDTIEQHREIAEALKANDEAQTELLIRQHVTQFQQKIRAVL
ncbi:MAG: hypothetical protein B6I35_15510 [Anaerolineaceae bacterium 4572_32.2]|nr:MAG: hypothetical protein B6I35_15510 [Anaerolineaceae bacterium 4572_32.2]